MPHANAEWWVRKLAGNRVRDAAATEQLTGPGWTVLRFWEHEAPEDVVARIAMVVAKRAVHSRGATCLIPSVARPGVRRPERLGPEEVSGSPRAGHL